jgi:hypothetical protein
MSPSFKQAVTLALTNSLNLGVGPVVSVTNVRYVQVRRQLLADSVIVDYSVTGNVLSSTITQAAMTSISSGSLTKQLTTMNYNSAMASVQPTVNSAPSVAPSLAPSMAPSVAHSIAPTVASAKSSAQSLSNSFLLIASIIIVSMYL